MAAAVQLGLDDTAFTAGLSRAEAKLARFAAQANAATKRMSSKENVKSIKDAFDPVSAGSLARLGAAGVAMYGVSRAAGAWRNEVEKLSKSEYLTSAQRSQFEFVSSQFTKIDGMIDRIAAKAIGGTFDFFSGGKFTDAADAFETGATGKRRAAITKQIIAEEEGAANDQRTDPEKRAAKAAQILDLEKQIAAERERATSGPLEAAKSEEKILELELKRVQAQRELVKMKAQEKAESDKAGEARRAAIEKFKNAEREAAEAAATPEQKLQSLVTQRNKVQEQIVAARGDELKQMELGAEREKLNEQIVRAQLDLAEKGKKQAEDEQKAKDGAAKDAESEKRGRIADAIDVTKKAIEVAEGEKDKAQSKQTLREDIAIAQEKNPRKKAELQREQRIRQTARQIAAETGIDPTAARHSAELLNPFEPVAETTRSGRKKIMGYSGAQRAQNKFLFPGGSPQAAAASAAKAAKDGPKDPIDILKAQLNALEQLLSY